MDKLKAYLHLFRIKHYIKNLIIFFPMFFSKDITTHNVIIIFSGILVFSLVSSLVYVLNDITDLEKDKMHPTKRFRPLPAGDLSIKEAKSSLLGIAVIGCIIIYLFQIKYTSILIIAGYLLINIIYSKYAKNIPIADVLTLAFGYLLRIFLGADLIHIQISHWLYFTVLFGALFMSLGKRRGEIKYIANGTESPPLNNTRKVLAFYNESFLDKNMYMSLAITIVFYALWCVSQEISSEYPFMIWTTLLVYAISMKYTLILEKGSEGDPISVILTDKSLIIMILIYIIVMFKIMYL